MAWPNSALTDYEHRADTVTVTFTGQISGNSVATVKANPEALSFRETQAGAPGGIEQVDQVWILWVATLDSNVPRQGDSITDPDGDIWTILSMPTQNKADGLPVSYRCVSRKQ